ncbi:hypothetical protein [Sorangium cellulosum]|uniref:Uncharacterized protein n=1 Tax=Sorangium cellulosum TaxID=56 RepID=A0A150QFX1_SORCE|nr:hypothetical protein [Sorangium cellulosum]KYF66849.1 hypothetical protein BE15_39110 [Sorangium cellulosum]
MSRRLGPGDAPESLGSILRRVFPTLPAPISDAPPPPRGRTPAVLFCARCGSAAVDVVRWAEPTVPVFRCAHCDHEVRVPGLTIGRYYGPNPEEVLRYARTDAAVCLGVERTEAIEKR